MARKRRSRGGFGEDATGQAGWMYVDLLLGLIVVFMATVSFIPEINAGKPSSAYAYSQHFPQVFERAYAAGDPSAASIKTDVAQFLIDNDLPPQSIVESAQFIGGYDGATEQVTAAIARAVEFSMAIDKQDKEFLANAANAVDGNSSVAKDVVLVKLKFGVMVR